MNTRRSESVHLPDLIVEPTLGFLDAALLLRFTTIRLLSFVNFFAISMPTIFHHQKVIFFLLLYQAEVARETNDILPSNKSLPSAVCNRYVCLIVLGMEEKLSFV